MQNRRVAALLVVLMVVWILVGFGCGNDPDSTSSLNHAPRISGVFVEPDTVYQMVSGHLIQNTVALFCQAEDSDDDSLSYSWSCAHGEFSGAENLVTLAIRGDSLSQGKLGVYVEVSDNMGGSAIDSVGIAVRLYTYSLAIDSLTATADTLAAHENCTITCHHSTWATYYSWWASNDTGGEMSTFQTYSWVAPELAGEYWIYCLLLDAAGGSGLDSLNVVVASSL